MGLHMFCRHATIHASCALFKRMESTTAKSPRWLSANTGATKTLALSRADFFSYYDPVSDGLATQDSRRPRNRGDGISRSIRAREAHPEVQGESLARHDGQRGHRRNRRARRLPLAIHINLRYCEIAVVVVLNSSVGILLAKVHAAGEL